MESKKRFVSRMFSDITREYDFLNRVISLGLDLSFRKKATQKLCHLEEVLDICAGTGDMAISLLKNKSFKGKVVLCDFNKEMLALARLKLRKLGFEDRVDMVLGDAERLPFKRKSFPGVMMGFSLRNLENLKTFILEMKGILKKRGKAVLLEIAHPENPLIAPLFYLYFYRVLPLLARVFTKNSYAYHYLPQSLKIFYKQKELITQFKKLGFKEATYQNIFTGVSAIYQLTP